MNKAITINLNGRAYQIDEEGYKILQDYLHDADIKLQSDPDKAEIVADLEQALADKLEKYLNPGKNVITDAEAKEVISEMGPVQEPASGEEKEGDNTASEKSESKQQNDSGVKKLYRVHEDSMFFGVCAGLAAYFNVSLAAVRIVFIILALITHGIWVVVYFLMMLVMPAADTPAEKAAAYGAPFTAQEFVNRARAEYQKFAESGSWNKENWDTNKQDWKQKMRQEKHRMRQQMRQERYRMHQQMHEWKNQKYSSGSPFIGLFLAALAIVWIWGLVTIVSHQMIFGIAAPGFMPIWVVVLLWTLLYAFVASSLRISRWRAYSDGSGNTYYHSGGGFMGTVAWLVFLVLAGWFIWHFAPASHPFFLKIDQIWLRFWNKIK